jgi:hypothetical protein
MALTIVIIQLFDIVLHAETGQLEIIRVTSNLVILTWLAILISGRWKTKFLPASFAVIGAYLMLNAIFLAQEGIVNVEQGGGLRVTLFLLVFFTTVLSALLIYTQTSREL